MMKKTVSILFLILMFAVVISGCAGRSKGAESDEIVQKNQDETEVTPSMEPTESPATVAAVTPTAAPTQGPDGILYQNDTFGFSIEFPRSWEGKFSISEFDKGISVTFRPSVPIEEGRGRLFSLVKDPVDDEASFLDGAQWIQTDNASYVYGGPTDVTYEESDPEYDTFVTMRDQIPEIMKTLK